jgi:hypothetical protein
MPAHADDRHADQQPEEGLRDAGRDGEALLAGLVDHVVQRGHQGHAERVGLFAHQRGDMAPELALQGIGPGGEGVDPRGGHRRGDEIAPHRGTDLEQAGDLRPARVPDRLARGRFTGGRTAARRGGRSR